MKNKIQNLLAVLMLLVGFSAEAQVDEHYSITEKGIYKFYPGGPFPFEYKGYKVIDGLDLPHTNNIYYNLFEKDGVAEFAILADDLCRIVLIEVFSDRFQTDDGSIKVGIPISEIASMEGADVYDDGRDIFKGLYKRGEYRRGGVTPDEDKYIVEFRRDGIVERFIAGENGNVEVIQFIDINRLERE